MTLLDYLSIAATLMGFAIFVTELVLLERERRITLARLTKWALLHGSVVGTGLSVLMLSKSSPWLIEDPDASYPARLNMLSTKDFIAFAVIYIFVVWRSLKSLE
jgi:hypothetical protein